MGARPWELVVHSPEWTTGWDEKAGKGPETGGRGGASGPLAGMKSPENGWKPGKVSEPVDHFEEWTTGWGGLPFLALLSLFF